jgi:hypothetical protein
MESNMKLKRLDVSGIVGDDMVMVEAAPALTENSHSER